MNEVAGMWMVVIEFDGVKAQNKWYRRLHKLGFYSRRNKAGRPAEDGPLTRRESANGVIFQEGAIICKSESMARELAFLASDTGAVNVSLVRVQSDFHLTRTRQDAAILDRIENVLGKRGKTPPAQRWAVTCTECLHVSDVEHWSPVNCPNCGGFVVHNRLGQVVAYADPGGDVFDAWRRVRFAGPHWEPAPLDPAGQNPPATVDIGSDRERAVVDLLADSPVLAKIRTMPRDVAFTFLDAIFANRAYRDSQTRQRGRVEVATSYLMRGGDPARISLPERQHPDLVDAGNALGADAAATWMLAAM